MKFRTEIEIAPFQTRIGYDNRTLALGSCFAAHIASRLAEARFRVAANPTGILFNPLSIAARSATPTGRSPSKSCTPTAGAGSTSGSTATWPPPPPRRPS